jgi:hypothetical protein
MTKPLIKGTVKLSSIGKDAPSTKVATIAPAIPIHKGSPGTMIATKRHIKRQEKLPSRDFFLILIFPYLLPIKAAAISPKMMKEMATMAALLSKRSMLKTEAVSI